MALNFFTLTSTFVRKKTTQTSLKDDQHPTYVIMLCKRETSMISANFFRNECVKNEKKNIFFFFLKLMNINV